MFRAIIALPDRNAPLLSFINLVEAHVLDALRREHEVPLQKVRKAILCLTMAVLTTRRPMSLADR